MEFAMNDLKRYEQLFKNGVVTKEAIEEKERGLKVAKAMVKEAEEEKRLLVKGPKQETLRLHEDTVRQAEAVVKYYKRVLEKTIITAPISGKVIHKYLEKGEIINKETPLVAVADMERIRINAEVDETDIGRIQIGDSVEVTSDTYPGRIFKGEVQEISDYVGVRKIRPNNPAKNLDMKVIQVKIKLREKPPFKLGMTIDIRIMPKETVPPG
ncbi:MAG: efflux RND transporter periplasmic adaptor subunit [Nitrospirae bacterium]|nr:efflux RND transporter periplasmic adaptor subunit [Nitrospirota bacterium]